LVRLGCSPPSACEPGPYCQDLLPGGPLWVIPNINLGGLIAAAGTFSVLETDTVLMWGSNMEHETLDNLLLSTLRGVITSSNFVLLQLVSIKV
jgi:hypothetical protein